MRAINPEQVLSLLAVAIGLVVGVGVIGSTAAVAPGCASAECQSPVNVTRPANVLECPSGTLCYQGACLRSCASGAENVEKCDTDDDCSTSVRPNCVDRRCSSCETGERCIPALDICSAIRGNEDNTPPVFDAGTTPAINPLDGGRIDGSQLGFDATVDVIPEAREVTHLLTIDVYQRTNLISGTSTAAILVDVRDVRGTGYVASTTVAPPIFGDGDECAVSYNDQFPLGDPTHVDLGTIQLQADTGDLERENGLIGTFVATYAAGRYTIAPPLASPNVLVFSTRSAVRGTEITGEGRMGLTNGRWPVGSDAPEVITPDIFEPSVASRTALTNLDLRAPDAFFQLNWTKGLPLQGLGVRVVLTARNALCTLRCTSDESDAQLRVTARTLETFRNAPCNAAGTTLPIYFERSGGATLLPNSDLDNGVFIRGTAEVHHGFEGRGSF